MRECTIADLAAAHPNGATVVDVREPVEYLGGHVPGAIPMPMAQVGDRLREIPKTGPGYVICASGNRSKASADQLERAGFEAYSVKGGTMGWMYAGHPLVTGSNPT